MNTPCAPKITPLRHCPELLESAALWFSEKWDVPEALKHAEHRVFVV